MAHDHMTPIVSRVAVGDIGRACGGLYCALSVCLQAALGQQSPRQMARDDHCVTLSDTQRLHPSAA